MPSKYIQDHIIKIIEASASGKDVKIIDLSSSDGAILKRLHHKGYRNLTATVFGEHNEWEYKPAEGEFSNFEVFQNVDLLKPLPFGDGVFDFVVNSELLEHLENHRQVLSEIARIVKPGGLLVIETPNIMRLNSRLNFLFTGFHKPRTDFPPYHKPVQDHVYYHVFPVYLPVVDYFLYQYGMERVALRWNRWKWFPILLLLIFWPFILLNSAIFLWKEKTLVSAHKWRLFKLQNHPAVLLCNVLIFAYRKNEEGRES